jgi:methylenetetrahydrofolate dehydrogenase (NADP+)/methenyltetrahydrofolate cyclohydrolase
MQLIDGKAFAAGLRASLAQRVATLKAEDNLTPGLAVVLVGEDPASAVYVRNKKTQTVECGMNSFDYHLPVETSQEDLIYLIEELNARPDVHGILVQLPLPEGINEQAIINAIDPAKDVDGFHVVNTGKLATGQNDAMVSCTPLGCLMLIQDLHGNDLSGLHAVVIGRSNIVGKPMAQLLLNHNATVSICHSRTKDIEALCAQADILVAAVGRPEMVKANWIKPGATVIDVGINRVEGPDGKAKLTGDVAFDEASTVAGAMTPVPGGVGPMTIACLLRNTLQAAIMQQAPAAMHLVP